MSDAPLKRGFILLTLAKQYPAPMNLVLFEHMMAGFYAGDAAGLERDLAYLKSKGLISHKTTTVSGGGRLEVFKITIKGLDVAEQSVVEPGVEFA